MMMTMIKFLLIIITLVVISSNGMIMPPPTYNDCDGSRDAMVQCATYLLDGNKDGNITAPEIDQALLVMDKMGQNFTTEFFMKCDFDEDGGITLLDWNHPNSTCLPTLGTRRVACLVCVKNGFKMTHVENRVVEKQTEEAIKKIVKDREKTKKEFLERQARIKEMEKAKNKNH